MSSSIDSIDFNTDSPRNSFEAECFRIMREPRTTFDSMFPTIRQRSRPKHYAFIESLTHASSVDTATLLKDTDCGYKYLFCMPHAQGQFVYFWVSFKGIRGDCALVGIKRLWGITFEIPLVHLANYTFMTVPDIVSSTWELVPGICHGVRYVQPVEKKVRFVL